MPQAAQSGDAAFQSVFAAGRRQGLFDQFSRFLRRLRCKGRALLHLLPEPHGVSQLTGGKKPQPLMTFGQDKRLAARRQRVAIALLDGFGSFAARQAEVLSRNCQVGASGEPHEIQSIGGRPGFVEVVDAPNEPAFLVPPSAEVLDVQVADGEDGRRLCQIGADFRPKLQPAVKGRAEEGEDSFGHVLVFQGNVLADDGKPFGEPLLEIGACFEDIHGEVFGFAVGLDVGVLNSGWAAAEAGFVNREFCGKFRNLFAHALLDFGVADVGKNFRDPVADALHLGFAHTARGDRGAAQADSAAFHGG